MPMTNAVWARTTRFCIVAHWVVSRGLLHCTAAKRMEKSRRTARWPGSLPKLRVTAAVIGIVGCSGRRAER